MKNILFILLFIFTLQSCEDFLDKQPTGVKIPESVEDYQLLLQSIEHQVGAFYYLSPEIYYPLNKSRKENTYVWADEIFSPEQEDGCYTNIYNNIFIFNRIINNIEKASSSLSQKQRNQVKAQAYAGRAAEYFLMVNYYGKQYDASTASTDLSGPLVLRNGFEQTLTNATIQQVYDQILSDLKIAMENIQPGEPSDNKLASKAGIYGLYAKIYLNFGDYQKCYDYADLCLKEYSKFNDLTVLSVMDNEASLTKYYLNVENIWSKHHILRKYGGYDAFWSNELKSKYDLNRDGRYIAYSFYDINSKQHIYRHYKINFQHERTVLLSTPDVLLMKAESAARINKISEAMKLIDELQAKRISGTLTPNSASSQAEALQVIRDERYREVAFTGMNWFDQKRYHKEGRSVQTYTRTSQAGEIVTLEPGSSKYIINLPAKNRSISGLKSIK